MKNPNTSALLSFLLFLAFTSIEAQPVEWKHYEYNDINLRFDLPSDFIFEYPDDGSLSFVGQNSTITVIFKRIDKEILTAGQRKAELYTLVGLGDDAEDPNFMAGTTENGYHIAGTVSLIEELNEDCIVMLLSDPNNNKLNFMIAITYGGEGNENSLAYEQAGKIIMNFGPIVR